MSKNRRIRRRTCLQKLRYSTHGQAFAAKMRQMREGIFLEVYVCRFGKHFHLGKGSFTVRMLRTG